MGQYNKAILTTAGEKLIARALAGEIKLSITEAKTSSYAYPSNTDFKALTDMQGVKQTVTNVVTTVYNDSIIQTRALFSNEGIVSTYYIHNIGLYAMNGTQEVLFCIVTSETPDEVPQYNGVASTSYIYNIQNVVQDTAELSITVNTSGTATIQDVLERVNASGGNISETVIEALDTIADKYPVPVAGETVKRFLGKVLTFLRNMRPLTGDIALYISANMGSDITGDGSQSKPFKTIQHAINMVPKDMNGYSATINVLAGTYSEDVLIMAFHNGTFKLYSDTKDTLAGTCHVKSITVAKCGPGYMHVNGFDLTTTSRDAIQVLGSYNVHIYYCQSTVVALSYTGIQCSESFCSTSNCKITNRYVAASGSNSTMISSYWNSGTINNTYGLASTNGARVNMIGVQPSGNTNVRFQGTGGVFFYDNGTQISDLISSGLSCTWGTISGGYVRHGNLNGIAMVTIQIIIRLTTNLSTGVEYNIVGFPSTFITSAISCHDKRDLYYCQINTNGAIQIGLLNALSAGVYLVFTGTYLTTGY